MARVAITSACTPTILGHALQHLRSEGHEGWIYSIRKSIRRDGPQAYPPPLVPAIHIALTEPVFVLMIPCEGLLESGIKCENTVSYIDRVDCPDFLTNECKIVRLNQWEGVFVPLGWLAVPLYVTASTTAPG